VPYYATRAMMPVIWIVRALISALMRALISTLIRAIALLSALLRHTCDEVTRAMMMAVNKTSLTRSVCHRNKALKRSQLDVCLT
jgi:hypothetical protein